MPRLTLLLLLMLLASSLQAAVYTLHPDGTGDYATIQDAITASVDGDIIELTDGVYSGDGNFNVNFLGRSVTLRSISGNPEACIIDIMGIAGNGITERAFTFENGETNATLVSGITVQNGDADAP